MCQWKYALNYVLGIKDPSNKAAMIGNSVHKALEIRAWQKLAKQRGETKFKEPETGREFTVGEATPRVCINHAWAVYFPGLPYQGESYQTVVELFNRVLNDRLYDPDNLDIVQPEQYFDLQIPDEWAAMNFVDPHSGEPIIGQLAIRGTVDLVYREPNGSLAYCDWKTGRKWDWVRKAPKDFNGLMEDFQMLLYYYALRRLYPNEPDVLMTIYFVREDGPTTLAYTDKQVELCLKKICERYRRIVKCEMPTRMMDKVGPKGQPCSYCSYNKEKVASGESICDYYWGELQTLGMDKLIKTHGKAGTVSKYGDGGGQANRDEKRLPGE